MCVFILLYYVHHDIIYHHKNHVAFDMQVSKIIFNESVRERFTYMNEVDVYLLCRDLKNEFIPRINSHINNMYLA